MDHFASQSVAFKQSRFPWVLLVLIFAVTMPTAYSTDPAVLPAVSSRFALASVEEVPNFQRHVSPLLGRVGCNGRNCHGSFQGQGGLRLSLFGYDFGMDHTGLTEAAKSISGKRIDRRNPELSLILQKPLEQIDHEGGQRFEKNSWQHHLLLKWIESGAVGTMTPAVLQNLVVTPSEIVFADHHRPVSLQVTALWSDGSREDVTPLCRFRTNDDSIATVSADGAVTSTGPGDTHIIAFYDNGIYAVPVLRPFRNSARGTPSAQRQTRSASPAADPSARLDQLVESKLQKLNLPVSELCTDEEFLRRVSLDLTGTLPSPQEVTSFLADPAADRRERKVDELLQRPAWAAWWATKLCDFTGCNPAQQAELGQELSVQWYTWFYERLLQNRPWDQIVGGIVLAQSRRPGQSWLDYTTETSAHFRYENPTSFADRETMPHYWTRRSMQEPSAAAQAFAQNFLGIRLQCAECHKHPFASWTQQDYNEFTRFFEPLHFGVAPDARAEYRQLASKTGLNPRGDDGGPVNQEVLRRAQQGHPIPWRELYLKPAQQSRTISLLRSRQITLQPEDDPRQPLMEWMLDDNPWFVRAFVNRVWASCFHVGIVEPPDDLNPANPPSNAELLNFLEQHFRSTEMDIRSLQRTIVLSNTWQRSWKPVAGNAQDKRNFSRSIPRRMPAEVVYDGVKQAVAASDRTAEVRTDLNRRATGHLSMRLAGTYAMQVFGKPERAVNCDCERNNKSSLLQTVFLQNDPLMIDRLLESGWLAELQQATSLPDSDALIHEAWLRTLSRPPLATEVSRARQHLQSAESQLEGLRDLLWALINTKEFLLIR